MKYELIFFLQWFRSIIQLQSLDKWLLSIYDYTLVSFLKHLMVLACLIISM